jgi:hypothetical protein
VIELIKRLAISIPQDQTKIPKAELDAAQFQNITNIVFALAAIVAVIFIILGGYRYSISQGNANDLQKGKDMIVYSLVGLGIVLFGFIIVQFVTARLF